MHSSMTQFFAATLIAALPFAMTACGSDDEDKPGGTGATGGAGSSAGGSGGSAGSTGGSSGSGGSAGSTGGSAGSGGTPSCDLSGAGKPRENLPAQITGTLTLDSAKVYVLEGNHYVTDGASLVIPPCTRIEGKKGPPPGTLIVSRGGKLDAVGTQNEPILFTSDQAPGARFPGDWGGVILLGKATNFEGDNVLIEGLAAAPENQYGGNDDADSSGHLSYVRIEYSGYEIGDGNEINGLTMGSVGSGTVIDHVMVSNTLDDGFEWFGGTVDASHLVVNNAGDDMFDADQGFRGSLQFLFGRQVAPITSDPNGFEMDSDKAGAKTPGTNLKVANATVCGTGSTGNNPTFGMVLREQLRGSMVNVIVTRFDTGVDTRDLFGDLATPFVTLTHSSFFEPNVAANAVGNPTETDNDMGFDENAWFAAGAGNAQSKLAGFGDCAANPPAVAPDAAVPGAAPSFGDTSASYVGAFEDKTDTWMTGAWIDWAPN